MTEQELIEKAKYYFTKDRQSLKQKILNMSFDGKEHSEWKKFFNPLSYGHPYKIEYGIHSDFVESISDNFNEINWEEVTLGDLSWEIEILLNENIKSGYDWGEKLSKKCGESTRIFRIFISDITHAFIYETYSMYINSKENYCYFHPISDYSEKEKNIINQVVKALKSKGYFYVSRKLARRKFEELYSDTNIFGNASLYDVLFSDVHYLDSNVRYNIERVKDAFDKEISLREFFDKNGDLVKRVEHQFYAKGNTVRITTNKKMEIEEVVVWKDTEKQVHKEFKIKLPINRKASNG